MPQSYADLECAENQLSERLFRAVAPCRGEMGKLGFSEVGFKKLEHSLLRVHREAGGINYLDASRSQFGQVLYVRTQRGSALNTERENITIAFTVVVRGRELSFTNNKFGHDAPPGYEVRRFPSANATELYERFRMRLRDFQEPPQRFPD